MYKIGSTNQTLKQTQVKASNQKDGMPPINLSRQASSKSSQSAHSVKKTYDQNKNTQGQQGSTHSSRSVSKQSSLGGEDLNNKLTEDKFKNLIIENNNLSIILEQKDQELDDLKNSYRSQYKEIMTKVDQMEQFIQQQDKRNQDMVEEQTQKSQIIEQLQAKIAAQEQIIEQERIKCMGYQANFTQIETHISQVISENENLNILKDQKDSEIQTKQEELQNALSKIEELELQLNIYKENNPQLYLESSELIKQQNELQEQNELLNNQVQSLEQRINELTSQQSEYQQKIQNLQGQVDQLQLLTSNTQNFSNVNQLESQATQEQTPMNVFFQNTQNSESQKQEEINDKNNTLISATNSVYLTSNLFEQEINKFKEELNLKQIIIEQLNEENAQLKYEIQQIQVSIANKYETASTHDQDEVLQQKTQINDLQNQISQLENKQIEQVENFTKILNEKMRAEQNFHNLNIQLECLKNELENSNSLAKSKKHSNETSSSRLEQLRAQLRQLSQENMEISQKNNQLLSDVDSLKSQLSIINISLEASQKLATIRGEELALFEQKFKQNLQQIDQYKSQYQSALENLLKYQSNIQQN
ncbi:hypothetical protein ABPG72_001790 [Tetrahymena utriculariae]